LGNMRDLARILHDKRIKRGAIGFDFPETKISVDVYGWPTMIKPYKRNTATGIIEEFMIAANETVAENYFWLESPFVYRSHEEPDPEKFIRLREFVACFSYTLKGQHPSSIQALLAKAEGSPEEHIINRMVLQSLKQARYTSQSLGHFGLASKYYCHFTSPIRRYPDLQIHRIIKEHLSGKIDEERIDELNTRMPEVCDHCSKAERAAETAERDVTHMKKAQFMSDKVGRVFSGIISGMHSRGIYVELPNTVEGMIHMRDLKGDRFVFDKNRMCVRGELTKKVYNIGDRVKVKVAKVNVQAREIDFELLQ
ncbi:MAG: RNB domain-containing ribonuclease, partial [Defluviitaleaceae bacterium]|nr:RNB domain-containing ribonuclease [Defluviitaleaceae bacterium]